MNDESALFAGWAEARQRIESSRARKVFMAVGDPWAQPVVDPTSAASNTNMFKMLIFSCILGVFTIMAFISFANRPVIETFSLLPMSAVPPQSITLSIVCSHNWACYHESWLDADGVWQWNGTVSVTQTFSGDALAACGENRAHTIPGSGNPKTEMQFMPGGGSSESYSGRSLMGHVSACGHRRALMEHTSSEYSSDHPCEEAMQLCYSPSSTEGIRISVPGFTTGGCGYGDASCSPALKIIVGTAAASGMRIEIDLEPHQRKAIYVGSGEGERAEQHSHICALQCRPLLCG